MPIKIHDGKHLLVCLNAHLPSHIEADEGQGTMQRVGGAHAFEAVALDARGPTFTGQAVPVFLHICAVCGAVETYAARVVDPAAWG